MKLDSLDEKLILMLGQNARQSSQALAKKLKVTPGTIRRRIRELLRKNVLRIIGVVDSTKVGFPLAAAMAFNVEHEKLGLAVKSLADKPEIKWLASSTGRYDVIAMAQFRSTDELYDFIQREITPIEGLKDSETFVCLSVEKGQFGPMYRFPTPKES
ncbi:MAG: Lrp/AsnC family transcriptional regulator [Dehalococcoidales bacterium]|nr:Lrp/AsnC family transcriptional regulator [Dehalococcoidales bacterium]